MSFSFPHSIALTELFSDVECRIEGKAAGEVLGITQDSRAVSAGDLYCCVRGQSFDGHQFVADAIAAGAVAILADRELEGIADHVAVVMVDDVRSVLGRIASRGFEHPSRALTIVGITGTNGKTSTAAMLASILAANGEKVRVLGTLTGTRTTPEAIELQSILSESIAQGTTHVVMEVSSHALHQGRVQGITFDVGVFTNIARDHLDYHGTEENYFAAKALLFTNGQSRVGVINIDDTHGQLLVDVGGIPMRTFSKSDVDEVEMGVDRVSYTWKSRRITIPMGGAFTLMNSLAAVTTAAELSISLDSIVKGCASLEQVPGRFETVQNEHGVGVVVDYAHTPDGLAQVLASARELTKGRVISVFGCGGDRDKGKRPLMGKIAVELSDVVFVTSDNPRSEDPHEIMQEIVNGMSEHDQNVVHREVDRAKAIASAISLAQRGDIVVVAGKGHEKTQEINGMLLPFHDVEVAALALQNRKEQSS